MQHVSLHSADMSKPFVLHVQKLELYEKGRDETDRALYFALPPPAGVVGVPCTWLIDHDEFGIAVGICNKRCSPACALAYRNCSGDAESAPDRSVQRLTGLLSGRNRARD